jgi:hypothetical protein
MPSYAGARRILSYHNLFKGIGGHSADLAGNISQRLKITRNTRIFAGHLTGKYISISEGEYAAIAQVAPKLEWFKRELFKPLGKICLFLPGKNVRPIAEAGGPLRVSKQVRHAVVGRVVSLRAGRSHELRSLKDRLVKRSHAIDRSPRCLPGFSPLFRPKKRNRPDNCTLDTDPARKMATRDLHIGVRYDVSVGTSLFWPPLRPVYR